MNCVERLDCGCGDEWCVDNFHAYNPSLGTFFLEQCHSFCNDANILLTNVKNIDQTSSDIEITDVLYCLSSYNERCVSLCKALNELYQPLVAEFVMLANTTNEKCILDGNNVFEPLYKFVGATKQHQLIAVVLYHLNIQTNVSYIEKILQYIDMRIKQGCFESVNNF